MKPSGDRFERETTIVFNEADDAAYIWTASGVVYRHMIKRGYYPTEDGERHAKFEVLKRDIKLPRKKRTRKMTPEHLESLKKARFGRGAR